jgi:hypothetical protein
LQYEVDYDAALEEAIAMDWETRLRQYEGSPIRIWIEDRSGEEQTKPKPYTLYRVQQSKDPEALQFYLNANQFLTIPLFDETRTRIEEGPVTTAFVSEDHQAKLLYWVHFAG